MTSAGAPRRLHVERTADPTVLCWVLHDERLHASPDGARSIPEDSPLGRVTDDGSLVGVTLRGSTVHVEADDPASWPDLVDRVHAALLHELDVLDSPDSGATHWLLEPGDSPAVPPSRAEVQQIVDRAAGSVMSSHGGVMTVVAVTDDSVHLLTDGACNGCRQSDDTILGLIQPAVRAAYPAISQVVLDSAGPAGGTTASTASQRVPLTSRRRRRRR